MDFVIAIKCEKFKKVHQRKHEKKYQYVWTRVHEV